MSKLDDIEKNYAIVAPLIPPFYVRWLIARVRKLETALRHIAERDAPIGERAAEIEHIHAVAREALKEF